MTTKERTLMYQVNQRNSILSLLHHHPNTSTPPHPVQTTPTTPLATPVASPTNDDEGLMDLSWLPTALSPEPGLNELSTPILQATPTRDNWNIIDEIGKTEEIPFSVQAV